MLKTLLLLITFIVSAWTWELEETGLCIQKEGTCSITLQRYGVCCKLGSQLIEFKNYCLACQAVLILLLLGMFSMEIQEKFQLVLSMILSAMVIRFTMLFIHHKSRD